MHATSPSVSSIFTSVPASACAQPAVRTQSGEGLMCVPQGQHLHLHDRNGHVVTALRGTLWITQDGDQRDWILERGESMVIDRDADILISAMSDATIRLDS